jgi:hypothetical protein
LTQNSHFTKKPTKRTRKRAKSRPLSAPAAKEQLPVAFLRQAKAAGIVGVHANVSEGNAGGGKFFEKFGFVPLCRENRFRLADAPDQQTFTIVYGKKL